MKKLWLLLTFAGASPAWSQPLDPLFGDLPAALGEGWAGFLNLPFLGSTLLTLILAAALGAAISFHPRHRERADTLEELEAPKVYVLYAVIGAFIGILVVAYGYLVGFIVFGIGGLIRFRTLLTSANLTGRVILVTLIGLGCGLRMPHVAVLATVFTYILIHVLETRITYRVDVHALAPEHLAGAAAAYRDLLEAQGCRVISVRQYPLKQRLTLLVVGPPGVKQQTLEEAVENGVAEPLRGTVDWESD
jgi:hypothetical protein